MPRTVPRRFGVLAAVLWFTLLVSQSAAASNIVVNPGFETGDFTSWNLDGDRYFNYVSMILPHGEEHAARLGQFYSRGYLSQELPTTPGAYVLSFWLSNEGGTPNYFAVYWGGDHLGGGLLKLSLTDVPGFTYTQYSIPGLVAVGPTTVRFEFQQDPHYWHLDDVEVTRSSSVAEPGSSLLLLGIGLAGLRAWRKR
jgi:hypothetical protein